jgi:hypothetical protein
MDTNGMQGNDMKGHCDMCGGHANCGGRCRQHHWMHIIIKILVALFIFWCGVQFGELKGILRANYGYGYGYGMMNSWDGRNQGYSVPVMMGGWTYTTALSATTTKGK